MGQKDKALKSTRPPDSTSGKASQVVVGNSLPPHQVPWTIALSSSVLLWASFAPLQLTLTSLFALIPWVLVCASPTPFRRSDYFRLWIGGCLFWLLILQGIRLAYWPLYAGWIALSLYLAIFIPLFVGLTRILHHHWRIPLWLAAPSVWMALELSRAYFLTGYAGSLLAHSLVRTPLLLQAADQISVYGVGAWVVLVNTVLAQAWLAYRARSLRPAIPGSICGVVVTVLVLAYGQVKMTETRELASTHKPLLRIALIQENAPTMFEATESSRQDAWQRYAQGTKKAVERFESFDLVVWPESVFTATEPIMLDHSQSEVPPELATAKVSKEQLTKSVQSVNRMFTLKAQALLRAARYNKTDAPTTDPMNKDLLNSSLENSPTSSSSLSAPDVYAIVGTDIYDIQPTILKRYNCAGFIGPNAQLLDSYAKMHLVMFGEYFPFNGFFGILYQLFGMAPLSVGEGDKIFHIREVRLAPSVCFESMVPHRIASQVRQLTAKGDSPDILVNITNDGWFRGSSMLDHHLACSVLMAIENRRPMVIAANTGISAWIDGGGQVQSRASRMSPDQLLAEPYRDSRWGLFQVLGDWPIRIITMAVWLIYIVGVVQQKYVRREKETIEAFTDSTKPA